MTTTINEIVKPMERGQITIPISIRKKLKITPQDWLWVRLVNDRVVIEPVIDDKIIDWEEKDRKKLLKVLKATRGVWAEDKTYKPRQKKQQKLEAKAAKELKKSW